MMVIWQVVSFFSLLSLLALWGMWVYETFKEYPIPEKLGAVTVHGVAAAQSEPISRAIALGVSGMIAEHFRIVDRINEAAQTAGQNLIITTGPPPESLLLASTAKLDPINVSVQFGGAKLDSNGLARLFQREQSARATLDLSVSLVETAEPGKWDATASASYNENNAYGFLSRANGTIDDIASAIAMRFIQAHYAASDLFHDALPTEDLISSSSGKCAARPGIWHSEPSAADLKPLRN